MSYPAWPNWTAQQWRDAPTDGSAGLKAAEFNPNQERDENGRWTDGNATTGPGVVDEYGNRYQAEVLDGFLVHNEIDDKGFELDHGRVVAKLYDPEAHVAKFDSEQGYKWHEEGPAHEWAAALPKESADPITDYAGFGYREINAELRGVLPTKEVYVRDATPEEREQIRNTNREGPYEDIPLGNGQFLTLKMYGADKGTNSFQVRQTVPDQEMIDKTMAHAAKIDTAIREHGYVLPEAIEVGRAAYIPDLTIDEVKSKIGGTVTEPGFSSTMVGDAQGRLVGYAGYAKFESLHARYGSGQMAKRQDETGTAMVMHITVPAGSKVAAVEALRQHEDSRSAGYQPTEQRRTESEVLLGSGARFLIERIGKKETYTSGDKSMKPVTVHHVYLRYMGGGSSQGKS